MAMISISSEEAACLDAFKASVMAANGPTLTADYLCDIGHFVTLSRAETLPTDTKEDRLVYIGSGSAKLVAQSRSELGSPLDSRLNLRDKSSGANNHVLAFHFPGDIVSVLRQSDTDFRLIALGDVQLLVFSTDSFLDVAQDDPVLLRSVLTRSLQALHRSRTKMMQLSHKSARQRIADFLVSMAERTCNCTCGACEMSLPMSRRDIGDSLGLTIETVSRQFTELREAGLVETEGRSLVKISSVDELSCKAGNSRTKNRKFQF